MLNTLNEAKGIGLLEVALHAQVEQALWTESRTLEDAADVLAAKLYADRYYAEVAAYRVVAVAIFVLATLNVETESIALVEGEMLAVDVSQFQLGKDGEVLFR